MLQGISCGPVNKADELAGDSMTAQSVFEIVERYSKRLGVPVAPHDLRRTFAKLAHRGHAPLEQIQLSLGQCVGADDGTVFVVGAGSGGCAV